LIEPVPLSLHPTYRYNGGVGCRANNAQ